MTRNIVPPDENEGEGWQLDEGKVFRRSGAPEPIGAESETLSYNNPFNLEMERVWYDGRVVYAVDCGQVTTSPDGIKVAMEYQPVYSVELDANGLPKGEPKVVPGQYNIYDSVPGMEKYSPLWQFNFVLVPEDYEPNSLRSEADCLKSGYKILKSNFVEN